MCSKNQDNNYGYPAVTHVIVFITPRIDCIWLVTRSAIAAISDTAIDAISDYIGDDGLYDDLYDNGKKNSKGDARPVIRAAMKRLGIKEEKETILDRIDKKIQERKNG